MSITTKPSFLGFHGLPRKSSQKSPKQATNIKETSPKTFQPNVEEMKWVFDKFDTNKDGKISLREYKAALKALGKGLDDEGQVGKAFEAVDTDGNGSIDFKEFMEMIGSMDEGVKASDLQSAFKVFDLDGNGKISPEELMEVLKMMGERCNLDACRKMIRGVDGDGDGCVDINEFMTMMTRNMKFC